MAKLPKIEVIPLPAWQQKRLSSWLLRWSLDQMMRKGDLPTPPIAVGPSRLPPGLVSPYDPHVAVGQIRLLSPRILPKADSPVYVAVLRTWDKGWMLVAPYGPFAEPADPGELLSGRTDRALRILCLWNARSVPTSVLETSWIVDELSRKELEEAWAVFRSVSTGVALPEPLAKRVGPPILHPWDPRLTYQKRQMALLQPLLAKALIASEDQKSVAVDQPSNLICLPDSFWKGSVFRATPRFALAAAEEPVAKVRKATWKFVGTKLKGLSLTLRVSSKDRPLFMVFDQKGEFSTRLDGAVIVSKNGKTSRPFKNGQAACALKDLKPGFVLRHPVLGVVKLGERGQGSTVHG